MKKIVLSFLFLFLIISSTVLAQDFSIDTNVKEYYVATQSDYITLKINNPAYEDWFSVALIGPEKWVEAETSLLRVPTAGSETMKITVSPPRDAIPHLYPYQYFLKITRVGTDSVIEKSLLIRIKQITNAIIKDMKLSCTECTSGVDVSGTVYNVGSDPIELSLILKLGNQIKTIPLGFVNVYGKQDFRVSFDLSGMGPGDYDVDARLIDVNGKEMYEESDSFKIPAIENIVYGKDVSSTIFGSLVTVTATNKGNTVSTIELSSVESSEWYSWYSGPAPTGMFIGKNYWRLSLSPNESKSISYSEIYWPTYAVILLGIVAVLIAYLQMSAFSITKNVVSGSRIRPGKEISVALNLKNKKGEIDRAIVRDVVPPNYSIVSKFETVKPVIRKIGEGIELNWKVSKLKPQEERVFHYTIKPIEPGKGRLPSARVRAVHDDKMIQKNSNKVSLSQELEADVVRVKVKKD